MNRQQGRRLKAVDRRRLTSSWSPIFAFILLVILLSDAACGKAAVSSDLSWRLRSEVFELSIGGAGGTKYRVTHMTSPPKVVVDVALSADLDDSGELEVGDVAVRRVRASEGPLGLRVVIDLAYPLPRPLVQADGDALVITLRRIFRSVDETQVVPGVWFGQVRGGEVHGPINVKYLRVDVGRPSLRVYPALASGRFALDTVSRAARRYGALAAVNGGYFHWTGRPLGLLVLEGRLVSEDVRGRTAFGLRADGTPFIAPLSASLWLEDAWGRRILLDGINRPRVSGEAVAYTSHYGPLPTARGVRVYVRGGVVVAGEGSKEAPEDGFVVEYDENDARFLALATGERWTLRHELLPDVGGEVVFALGAGPTLLVDGEIQITGTQEGFQPDVLYGRAPRTALGLTADGKLLLVVVDGRAEGFSSGMTLEELAFFMKELGAVSAMNLDGGGSSTLVVGGWVLNRPSGGEERAVASVIVVDAAGEEL